VSNHRAIDQIDEFKGPHVYAMRVRVDDKEMESILSRPGNVAFHRQALTSRRRIEWRHVKFATRVTGISKAITPNAI
jgi:hypothetical protein